MFAAAAWVNSRDEAAAQIGPLQWSQVAGGISSAAVAPDGSLWALSNAPGGPNKLILRFANGRWSTIPGSADSIAVGPDGTAYMSNWPKGVYAYQGGTWKTIGGAGLRGITVAADGSVYALGAAGNTGDRAIWRYAAGRWSQSNLAGVRVVASTDGTTYSVRGVGIVQPDGYFVLKANGTIWYCNAAGACLHFGGLASNITSVAGGFVALAFPATAGGEALSYFDYPTAQATNEGKVAAGLAAGLSPSGPWSQLYAIDSTNRMWTTRLQPSSPLSWSSVTNSVTKLAVAPDASLWALLNVPSGVNKLIARQIDGTWRIVPGSADSIAIGTDNTVYISNYPKGIYAYAGRTWQWLGGAGFSGVTVGADGTVYALGATGADGNRAIWRYANARWSKEPIEGSKVVASLDVNTYVVRGVGEVEPDGFFVLENNGSIYYCYATGTKCIRFSGTASDIMPVPGGFLDIRFPGAASGNSVSYFDYATGTLTHENVFATALASGSRLGGPWTLAFAIDSGNRVWSAPARPSGPLAWSQIPGTISKTAVSPDGTVWGLSPLPSGVNKYILHYADGRLATIGGSANSIAVGPDGSIYISNYPKGIYRFAGRSWTWLHGAGLTGVTVASDGSLYALTAGDAALDRPVWKYVAGNWVKQQTTGVDVAGSLDPHPHVVPGIGTIAPAGYYLLKAAGTISYVDAAGTASLPIPGSAADLVTVPGGFFSRSAASAQLSYFDYASGLYTPEIDTLSSIGAGHAPTQPWTVLYATDWSDRLWWAPVGPRSAASQSIERGGATNVVSLPAGTGNLSLTYSTVEGTPTSTNQLEVAAYTIPPLLLPNLYAGFSPGEEPLLFIGLKPTTATVTFAQAPTIRLNLPGVDPTATYGLFACHSFGCTAWAQVRSRGTAAGSTLTFTATAPARTFNVPFSGVVLALAKLAPVVVNASTACIAHSVYASSFPNGNFQTVGFNPSNWNVGSHKMYGTDAYYDDGTAFPQYSTVAIKTDPVTGTPHVLALNAFPVPAPIATDPALALDPAPPDAVPTPLPGTHTQPHIGAPFLQYLAGKIETSQPGGFAQAYGYWDARIRFPKGQGLWPAFWLYSSSKDAHPTEFDIAELIDQDAFINEQIWLNDPGSPISGITGNTGWGNGAVPYPQIFDPSQAYHDYGILILPTGTTWFIDGYEVQHNWTAFGNFSTPHGETIVLDLQVGDLSSWPGLPDGQTTWPASMYVQYVRAYRPSANHC